VGQAFSLSKPSSCSAASALQPHEPLECKRHDHVKHNVEEADHAPPVRMPYSPCNITALEPARKRPALACIPKVQPSAHHLIRETSESPGYGEV
jgi:hypothetical protein